MGSDLWNGLSSVCAEKEGRSPLKNVMRSGAPGSDSSAVRSPAGRRPTDSAALDLLLNGAKAEEKAAKGSKGIPRPALQGHTGLPSADSRQLLPQVRHFLALLQKCFAKGGDLVEHRGGRGRRGGAVGRPGVAADGGPYGRTSLLQILPGSWEARLVSPAICDYLGTPPPCPRYGSVRKKCGPNGGCALDKGRGGTKQPIK
jgi:hypothetical protein